MSEISKVKVQIRCLIQSYNPIRNAKPSDKMKVLPADEMAIYQRPRRF